MTIANSGYIISGKEDDGTQNVAGNAIHITGGNNSLILHEGSVITGDVQVNNSSILKIINNDYTGPHQLLKVIYVLVIVQLFHYQVTNSLFQVTFLLVRTVL